MFAQESNLRPFLSNKIARENSFSIYTIRSHFGLDWTSPNSLIASILRNSMIELKFDDVELATHNISHMAIAIRCKNEREIYTGMTVSDGLEAPTDIFINGYGLGIITKTQGGRLQKAEEITDELDNRTRLVGNVTELRIHTNEAQCRVLKNFLSDYVQRGIHLRYGSLVDRPLRGDGGGCAAFAMAFLRLFDLIPIREEEMAPDHFAHEWRRRLVISRAFMGSTNQSADVGIYSLLFGDYPSWTLPGYESVQLEFWDPELLHSWLQWAAVGRKEIPILVQLEHGVVDRVTIPMKRIEQGLITGVEIDMSHTPLKIIPIWDIVPNFVVR